MGIVARAARRLRGADALKKTMLPLARQSMTYKGKLYGLPYYTSYSA